MDYDESDDRRPRLPGRRRHRPLLTPERWVKLTLVAVAWAVMTWAVVRAALRND